MAGRDAERLAQLAADVGGETFALDATSTGGVAACLRHAVKVFGRIDGAANCVASLLLKPAHAMTDQVVRVPARLQGRNWLSQIDVAQGDVFNRPRLAAAMAGVETAYRDGRD